MAHQYLPMVKVIQKGQGQEPAPMVVVQEVEPDTVHRAEIVMGQAGQVTDLFCIQQIKVVVVEVVEQAS